MVNMNVSLPYQHYIAAVKESIHEVIAPLKSAIHCIQEVSGGIFSGHTTKEDVSSSESELS